MNASPSRQADMLPSAEPGKGTGLGARLRQSQIVLWRSVVRRLRENGVMAMSAALSFRTIFAMVPILVLGLLTAKSLGVLEDNKRSLRHFLEVSGLAQIATVQDAAGETVTPSPDSSTKPAKAKVINVAEEIEKLVTQVEGKLTFERIGPVGGILLIWTALGLMTTMEQSLNRVFGAPRDRAVGRRIWIYWSAMTLGPIALAAIAYLGQQAVSTLQSAPGFLRLVAVAGWIVSLMVGALILAAFYTFLPNTRVRYRWAICGAVVVVPCWLAARWGFAMYVQHLVVKGNLYGVLGLLPLFLMWLNLSWFIFLLGAEVAHSAAALSAMQWDDRADEILLGPSDILAAALAIARPYLAGGGLATLRQITAGLRLPERSVRRLLDRLIESGIVCAVNDSSEPRYVLARPAAKIPVLEVLEIGDPRGRSSETAAPANEIAAAVNRLRSHAQSSLAGLTLGDVLSGDSGGL